MTYKLIEKMVNATVLLRPFPIEENDHPDIKEAINKIKGYPGFAVVTEVRENFKENFRYPEAIKQLESDYKLLLNQIEENIKHYSEEEKKAWRGWIKILEKQIKLRTIHLLIIRNYSNNNTAQKLGTLKDKPAWFQVGFLFATGQIQDSMKKNSGNASKVAKEFFGNKWDKYRPYISESYSNTNVNDKNIFSKPHKIKEIEEFCNSMELPISEDFTT